MNYTNNGEQVAAKWPAEGAPHELRAPTRWRPTRVPLNFGAHKLAEEEGWPKTTLQLPQTRCTVRRPRADFDRLAQCLCFARRPRPLAWRRLPETVSLGSLAAPKENSTSSSLAGLAQAARPRGCRQSATLRRLHTARDCLLVLGRKWAPGRSLGCARAH